MSKRLVVTLLGFFVLLLIVRIGMNTQSSAPQLTPSPSSTMNHAKTQDDLMAEAKSSLASGDPATAIMDIAQLTPENSERPEVRKIEKLAQKQQEEVVKRQALEDHQSGITLRKEFVDQMERQYLQDGMDVHLEARGRDADTLYMKFVLIGRPDVYQFSSNS